MKKWLPLFLMLAGCSGEIPPGHKTYAESLGWHLDKKETEETNIIDYTPELYESLAAAGLDLAPYDGEEVTASTYSLQEKQKNGEGISLVIYESNNRVIGAVGVLEDWTPGVFSPRENKELIEKDIVDK
ncbi:DUF4830 domain-containing protein [Domibacillus indicus]|uniref:DUF4830 domain-containing protein n=1 Tax=Domibacillus indicus TaxID=1437523 RepID=UPI00061811D0|nr:DUF4830 domain-containing protein [Domibacillus indicus]